MNTFMFEKQSYPKPITEQDIRKIIKDDGLEVIEETLTGLLLYCAQLGKELSVNFIEKISASNIADRIHISSAIPENYHIDKNVLAQYLWNVCDRNAFVTLNEIVILWNDGENLDPEQARLYEEYYDEFVRELAVNQLGQMWFDRNIVAINMYEIVKTAREIAEENKNFSSPYFKFENILREGILTTALHELRHLQMDTNIFLSEEEYPWTFSEEDAVEGYCLTVYENNPVPFDVITFNDEISLKPSLVNIIQSTGKQITGNEENSKIESESLEGVEMKAVIIERDYKGQFERYALTMDEFKKEFEPCLKEGMPLPSEYQYDTYTFRPMVHVWYTMTDVGSELWNTFFTNMEWEMSEGDIKAGNFAYIREDFMQSLKQHLPQGYEKYIEPANAEEIKASLLSDRKEIEVLKADIADWRQKLEGIRKTDTDVAMPIERELLKRECQLCAVLNGIRLDEDRFISITKNISNLSVAVKKAGSIEAFMRKHGLLEFKMSLFNQIQSAETRAIENQHLSHVNEKEPEPKY